MCVYEQSTFLNPTCMYRVTVLSDDYRSPLSWHWWCQMCRHLAESAKLR